MIKQCPICKEMKNMRSNQKYCSKKCKKDYENSQRSARKADKDRELAASSYGSAAPIKRPQGLNAVAGEYWDRIAPTVQARGHLNVLSQEAFVELCDLHSRLTDINGIMNGGENTLFQRDDKKALKESVLSDLKRKYSKQFLDYCKAFYLTPLSNQGNFGLPEEKKDEEEDKSERFFK